MGGAGRMSDVRLYFRLILASFRGQMQYRLSFALSAVGNLIATGINFVAVWALFTRFGQVQGWSLAQVALCYGLVNMSFALAEAFCRGFDTFHLSVGKGEFDRVLLRPRGLAVQILGQNFQLMRIGRFAQGLAVLLFAAGTLELALSPVKLGMLLLSLICGALAFSGLMVLQATVSIWSVDSLEIFNLTTYGGVETAQYPLSLYDKWLRRFFTFVVPLGCVYYYPLLIILGKADPMGAAAWTGWASIWLGPVFFLVSLAVFRVGVRHYRSTGS
jgi:ABC-2 type transport system permease protein